ncbi:MAG TPA: MFS transporter [Armatimonadetes bacterium]|nr:MFS transporter [Armatimonadota bacterium]
MGVGEYNRTRLFVASCVALVATAMAFSVRTDIMDALSEHFILTKAQVGWVAGAAFWGFATSILIGSPLCDVFGMGRLLTAAFWLHIVGVLGTIFAPGFWILWFATLSVGLGNGLVEAVINPLIATIYADEKTHKLNVLHAWWPGGLIIGGLVAYALTQAHLGWQVKMATILIPALIYGGLILGQKFPATERVASGVPTSEMFREALRPMFLLWMFCMLLTAATELGPNQWMQSVLQKIANTPGILVLVYVSGLMFVLRFFAGPIVERISPIGLLWCSALLSAIGLFWLSYAHSVATAFVAATVFGVGICYFWPTMLGVTSERFPKGGALLLGLMGTAGNISVAFVLPIMGKIYDSFGPAMAFRYVALLPVLLMIIFGALFIYYRSIGGYQAIKLNATDKTE